MKLSADKIKKLAQIIHSKLVDEKLIIAKSAEGNVLKSVEALLLKDAQMQEDIENQARKMMQQFKDKVQSGEIDYQKMYDMVVKQLVKEKKLPSLKYSEERIKDLAFNIHDRLYMDAVVDYPDEERALSRLKEIMLDYFSEHDKITTLVKNKIASLKKNIIEGTSEWDVLYNKYLAEELQKRKM